MLEGKIIKFYRELKEMKQKDLGDGICSSTHISKIERGLTEVSEETILLLSQRLGIKMEEELTDYRRVDLLIKDWHAAIVKKLKSKADSIKEQLDGIHLLHIQDFYRSYTLVLTRYYLSNGKSEAAHALLEEMDVWTGLSDYEENMLLHIKGIYYLSVKYDYVTAISFLDRISLEHYPNQEYYYDLAMAYSSLNSRVLAFFNANKALAFFTKIRSFSRIVEAEMLMLIQLEQSEDYQFLSSEYHRLIDMTGDYGLEHQKAMLHHNLGYLNLRHGYFTEASLYYKKSMDARNSSDPRYVGSLEGYINSLTKEGKTTKDRLLKLVEEGLALCRKFTDSTFHHLFTMHRYSILAEEEQYYRYLESYAYPHFDKKGYVMTKEHYAVKLFDYYMSQNDMENANRYAGALVEKFRRNNQFV
ncbi:transcriptional regulator with XRE-family HTH domain [Bacillus tianshenii]|uniref:Transcriptional regulator with XRE-family HTH domain n=1 Tax=Sutcliffiella tianshenii TaxID=1463404 RepID=A0ABS2NYZ7_9BACI|nr:helix-turn-helix transcriptional regulator [Bacillus tianshenii]MBM7619917.1 transcriptional regulator with XRE-family HTH domain [Bacillus tianshenii]